VMILGRDRICFASSGTSDAVVCARASIYEFLRGVVFVAFYTAQLTATLTVKKIQDGPSRAADRI
jgi:hypothetical protein